MTCVVADSGPLIALAWLDLLHLPAGLCGKAVATCAVRQECLQQPGKPGSRALAHAFDTGLVIVVDDPIVPAAMDAVLLDPGERSAIALALQLRARLLIDELRGRRLAVELGIPVLGVCGLLLLAKQRKQLASVAPLIERLCSHGYYVSDVLRQEVLRLAGEAR
jgi:predicted nucleic acid-binding protein